MINPKTLALLAPGVLAALTVHEFAHAWIAWRRGDPTAKAEGRLTLNPLAHLDPIGTIMLFLVHFGWAKPVPVDPRYFAHPRRDMVWVALAGPASNVLLAAVLGAALQFLVSSGMIAPFGFFYLGMTYAVFINLMLAFFNLIPIPPLDGSKVVAGYLPRRWLPMWDNFERFGFLVLIALLLFGRAIGLPIFSMTILPLSELFYVLFTGGLPLGL